MLDLEIVDSGAHLYHLRWWNPVS